MKFKIHKYGIKNEDKKRKVINIRDYESEILFPYHLFIIPTPFDRSSQPVFVLRTN